jgi:hypothetical protein
VREALGWACLAVAYGVAVSVLIATEGYVVAFATVGLVLAGVDLIME